MKEKVIKNQIYNKIKALTASVKDKEIKKIMEDGIIVTGGCIVSLLEQRPVNDYDVYFKDFDTALKVGEYYLKLFKEKNKENKGIPIDVMYINEDGRLRLMVKSSGIIADQAEEDYKYFKQGDPGSPESQAFVQEAVNFLQGSKKAKEETYVPLVLTSNAITLSDSVQLITRFHGNAEELHKNFDFINCTNYWTSWNNKLVLNKEALTSIITKELKYIGSLYPICSMFRVRKYIERGYTINAGQILKMAFQISKLDLDNITVLQEQLVGVDAAYFFELLYRIKETQQNQKDTVDEIYISQLIDEIF